MTTVRRELHIVNKLGLHARAASKLVNLAGRYDCELLLAREGREVNAKSIMGVMMLAASKGTTLEVRAEGDDAEEAVAALQTLFAERFGEPE